MHLYINEHIYCVWVHYIECMLTCINIGVGWGSGGNGFSVLFGDSRFDASLPPFPDITKLAATSSSLVEWLLSLGTLTATESGPSVTTKIHCTNSYLLLYMYTVKNSSYLSCNK